MSPHTRIPITASNGKVAYAESDYRLERTTRLFLLDGSYVDTPLTMHQIESFIQAAGRGQTNPFLRTMTIDKSGKLRSELISYAFLARVTDLKAYA
jgi:hypothetical protein